MISFIKDFEDFFFLIFFYLLYIKRELLIYSKANNHECSFIKFNSEKVLNLVLKILI